MDNMDKKAQIKIAFKKKKKRQPLHYLASGCFGLHY